MKRKGEGEGEGGVFRESIGGPPAGWIGPSEAVETAAVAALRSFSAKVLSNGLSRPFSVVERESLST